MDDVLNPSGALDSVTSSIGAVADQRALICREWVDHFGAADPLELDLGVLMAIGEWARDGLRPPRP